MIYQPTFRCFQCISDANIDKVNICSGSYIQCGESNLENIKSAGDNSEYSFFGRCYSASVWLSDVKLLFMLAKKSILQLEQAAIKADTSFHSTNYPRLRKYICELFLASRSAVAGYKDQHNDIRCQLATLLKDVANIKRLQQLPDYIIFHSTKYSESEAQQAAHNYLHLLLDLYWLLLTLEYYMENDPVSRLDIFEKSLNDLLSDLIYVSTRKFSRFSNYTDLVKQSPFLCSCFKELWLLIQLLVEQLHSQHFCKDFWHYFNTVVKSGLKIQKSNNGPEVLARLWLLYHVTKLQGYDNDGTYIGINHDRIRSNYSLVEDCIRTATGGNSGQIDEQLMCSCLQLLASLQMNWWKKDATLNLLQLLWEYFYKRINTAFSVNETSGFSFNSQKSYDYADLTDLVLKHDLETTSANVSSYDVFLCLLGKYLKANPSHWPKLKGRIYSKLPATKFAELTDIGLHNLIQLFFVLAYNLNFNELTDKLQSLLTQLPAAKTENSVIIWSAHISLLLMRIKRGMTLSGMGGAEICAPILLAVHSASADRSRGHLLRIYIDCIKKLVDGDNGFQSQEHTLLGGWIKRYLQWCSHSDACYLLDILINSVKKVRRLGNQQEWLVALESHVIPSIIQLSSGSDAPNQVAELAAELISADALRFKTLLEHMTGDSVNINLSIKFLTTLLEENLNEIGQYSEHQTFIIQAWIRIAVLSTDKSSLNELTQIISHLPKWSETMESFDLSSTDDPLYAVIRTAGNRLRNTQTVMEKSALKSWFETYFGKMDRWAAPVLSAAERGDNAQLVLRIYTCAALLFLHCTQALYIKNKNTCLFYRLTSTLLLPAPILMNKKPSSVILAALRKTWHFFIRGITQLDYKSDNYIERTLRDMVVRYVPHMYDASSPLLRCLGNEMDHETSTFILDKIATTFLTCKLKNSHEFVAQALKLTLELSRYHCENVGKTEILVRTVLPSLFDLLTFIEDVSNRQIIFQIIEHLKTKHQTPQIKEIFRNSVLTVIDKHLPFYSTNVFRLIEALSSVLFAEIESLLPNLIEAVQKVECMRGVGYDNTLRKGLKRVREVVNNQTK